LHRLHEERDALDKGELRPEAGDDRGGVGVALPRDRSVMERRPLFGVWFVPSAPMNDATEATSGSARTTSASARWRAIMLVKEASGGASDTPMMRPVSCWGKKPLGTMMASTAVSPSVARVTTSVSG